MILNGLILSAGILLRILFLGERSLWLDEAWLANALLKPDFQTALQSFEAPVPILFVWLSRLILTLLPANEWSLRLLPCIAGIGSIILSYQLAKHFFGCAIAKISTFLISLNAFLIYYSKELKQYSVEMLAGLLAIYSTECFIKNQKRISSWFMLTACMLALPFTSYTFIFIIVSVSARILYESYSNQLSRTALLIPIAGVVSSAFSFLINSHSRTDPYLLSHWQIYFVDFSSASALLRWIWATLLEFTELYSNFYYSDGVLGAVLFSAIWMILAVGFIEISRKKNPFKIYFSSVAISIVCAVALRQLPVAPRLFIFCAPFAALIFANGIYKLRSRMTKTLSRSVQIILTAAFAILYAVAPIRDNILAPTQREEMRPLLQQLRTQIQNGDSVYVYHSAKPAFDFYWKSKTNANLFFGHSYPQASDRYQNELWQIWDQSARGRLWIIFSHADRHHDAKESILGIASKTGTLISSINETGADAYLFQN